MALVVTAESSVAAQPRVEVAHARLFGAVSRLSVAACLLTLVIDSADRALPGTAWLDTLQLGATVLMCAFALATCVGAWLTRRADTSVLLAATLAPVLFAVRAVSAAVLVALELSTLADVANIAIGLLLLGASVWVAAASTLAPASGQALGASRELFRRVAEVSAIALFGVSLSGAAVEAIGASWACRGIFPDCNGLGALPFGHDPTADIQLYHRLLAYVGFGLVLWLAIEASRAHRSVTGLVPAAWILVGATLLDAAAGAVSVSVGVPPIAEVAHTVASALTWSSAIVLIVIAGRSRLRVASPAGYPAVQVFAAYVQLTKPRVMTLLLATTATAMVIAARGMPDLGVFVATLVGGALMSGGAGAINHYVDRDIDPLMGRTAWRPIPSGVIAPRSALWFGIGLGVVASAILLVFVNPLAMFLAQLGLLGYVFIYTLWLKRSTPSNIVIGGAAGAIPPLVGWAAVTNEVSSLTAWYLFAIIFFWTPPHFWALSLLIRQHYERANIPMLPVVRGEDETRRQILLYSVLLVALTLVLSGFGLMGSIYFAAAAVLGGLFIYFAVRLWREGSRLSARRLYLYSILYLFALFAAMAVDRVVSS
jgi:protoheme IX farnesyltransferase